MKRIILGVIGMVLVAGCATGPSGEVRDAYSRGVTAAEGRSAPMAAADSRSSFAPTPAPKSRPGLGTEWGETRESVVRNVPFKRRSHGTPDDVAKLYYDDRKGVDTLFGMTDRGWRIWGKHATPRGLVKWGLAGPSGKILRTWDSVGRVVVEGERGERYSIVAKNMTDARVELVFSVDGLDVLDGRSASYKKRGYILGPGATVKVDGFRKSQTEVAAFRFSSVENSYAALKHGDTRNVGVVGLAVFRDGSTWAEPPDWGAMRGEPERRVEANPFPGQDASPP